MNGIKDDAQIEAEMQVIINDQWPPAQREEAMRTGGQMLADLNAFFTTVTSIKSQKINVRDFDQAVFNYDQAVARLARPAMAADDPMVTIDIAERTDAQAVIDGTNKTVIDFIVARM